MKGKSARRWSKVVVSLVLALGAFSVPSFAEELPVQLPTQEKASVSKEVDEATNQKPEAATKFYMYIPPDIIEKDYPEMGDEIFPARYLMLGAMVSGVAYLSAAAYSNGDKKASSA